MTVVLVIVCMGLIVSHVRLTVKIKRLEQVNRGRLSTYVDLK